MECAIVAVSDDTAFLAFFSFHAAVDLKQYWMDSKYVQFKEFILMVDGKKKQHLAGHGWNHFLIFRFRNNLWQFETLYPIEILSLRIDALTVNI